MNSIETAPQEVRSLGKKMVHLDKKRERAASRHAKKGGQVNCDILIVL